MGKFTKSDERRLEVLQAKGKQRSNEETQEFSELQRRYRAFWLSEFYKEFLVPIVPGVELGGTTSLGSPDSIHRIATVLQSLQREDFKRGPYFFDLAPEGRLAHHTTLESLNSIILSQTLRLSSLASMHDDPQEGKVLSSIIGQDEALCESFRRNCFSLSFNHFPEGFVNERYTPWIEYGDRGRGVALLFSYDRNMASRWASWILSEVHYENHDSDYFNDLVERMTLWQKERGVKLFNAENLILPITAFHKGAFFKHEEEVRLTFTNSFSRVNQGERNTSIKYSLDSIGQKRYFYELYFGRKYKSEYIDFFENQRDENPNHIFNKILDSGTHLGLYPKLILKEIILGFRLNGQHRLKTELEKLCHDCLGYTVCVRQSKFADHFS